MLLYFVPSFSSLIKYCKSDVVLNRGLPDELTNSRLRASPSSTIKDFEILLHPHKSYDHVILRACHSSRVPSSVLLLAHRASCKPPLPEADHSTHHAYAQQWANPTKIGVSMPFALPNSRHPRMETSVARDTGLTMGLRRSMLTRHRIKQITNGPQPSIITTRINCRNKRRAKAIGSES